MRKGEQDNGSFVQIRSEWKQTIFFNDPIHGLLVRFLGRAAEHPDVVCLYPGRCATDKRLCLTKKFSLFPDTVALGHFDWSVARSGLVAGP